MVEEMAVEKTHDKELIVHSDSIFFDTAKFALAQRVAQVFAASTMVPAHFQNNIPNCVIALNLASRMEVDPFMLFQNMYVVHGNPGIEAKLAIALVNGCGRFEPLEYTHKNKGEGDDWECISHAKELRSGKVLESATVSIKMAKDEGWYNKSGSKWRTMPELMLMYRSAMFFARVYCPEVLLGLKTREELYDIIELEPGQNGTYETPKEKAEKLTAEIKTGAKVEKKADYTPQEVPEPEPVEPPPPEPENEPQMVDTVSNCADIINGMKPGRSPEAKEAYIQFHKDNVELIRQMTGEMLQKVTRKWNRVCGGEHFPGRPLTDDEQQKDVPEIGTPVEVPPPAAGERNGGYNVQDRMDFLEKMAEFKKLEADLGEQTYTNYMKETGYEKSGNVPPEKHKKVLDNLTSIFNAL